MKMWLYWNLKIILDTRWVNQGAKVLEEQLVQWKYLPPEDATWEQTTKLQEMFPTLNLEDKITLEERSDDRPQRWSKRSRLPNPMYLRSMQRRGHGRLCMHTTACNSYVSSQERGCSDVSKRWIRNRGSETWSTEKFACYLHVFRVSWTYLHFVRSVIDAFLIFLQIC